MKPKVKVTSKDTGYKAFQELVSQIKKDNYRVKVGVLDSGKGSEIRDGGLSNAELAAVHEFGSRDGHIPERSFIRSTFDENHSRYVDELTKLLKRVLSKTMTVDKAFGLMGARIAADIKRRVTSGAGIPPPNAPSTVARKGSSRTLVDTGRMIGSVTWSVVRGLMGKD